MNILILSGHLPSSAGRQAGARVSYHICEYLARSNRVHLLSFATDTELATKCDRDLQLIESCEIIEVTNVDRLCGIATRVGLPWSIAVRSSSAYRARVKDLISRHDFDIALLDHTAMFQYVQDLRGVPIVAGIVHDVLTQLFERRSASGSCNVFSRLELFRVRRWEASTFGKLDVVLPLNRKDEELIATLNPEANQFVIQPWIHTFESLRSRPDTEPNSLLFWGALDRAENVDAALYAADEILPRVRQSVPSAKLYIAGNRSEDLRAHFAHRPEVVVTGFVDDLDSLFSKADIGLLPLRLGAGIKIKTLECMAAGLAVVTTSVGEEGVGGTNGIHYLVGKTTDEMVSHVVALLLDADRSRHIGSRARQFVHREYNFEARMSELDRYLKRRLAAKSCIAGRESSLKWTLQ